MARVKCSRFNRNRCEGCEHGRWHHEIASCVSDVPCIIMGIKTSCKSRDWHKEARHEEI